MVLISQISEQIKLTYHLAALLKRPGITGRYLESTGKQSEDRAYLLFDRLHVQEKLRQWCESAEPTRAGAGLDFDNEPIATPTLILNREGSRNLPESTLLDRLVRANTRRREQLQYWERRPFHELALENENEGMPNTPLPNQPRGHAQVKLERGRLGPKSISPTSTAPTFSTVARSPIIEERTATDRPPTVYASSNVANYQRVRVPDVPEISKELAKKVCPVCHSTAKPNGEQNSQIECPGCHNRLVGHFECPYCHMELDAKVMQDRDTWKWV
jgi:hypothetical protein